MKHVPWIAILCVAALVPSGYAQEKPAKNKLDTKVSLEKQDEPTAKIVEALAKEHGYTVTVDSRVSKDYEDGVLTSTVKLKEVPLRTIIRTLLEQHALVAIADKDGNIQIKRKEDVDKDFETRSYDVRDLMVRIRDNPTEWWLRVPESVQLLGNTGDGRLSGAVFDGGNVVLGGDSEEKKELPLTNIVVKMTGTVQDWSDPKAAVEYLNGRLVVSQSIRVHKEIKEFIKRLRDVSWR